MAAVMMAYPVRESFHGYPQQFPLYPTRAHQPQADVAQTLSVNPYASFTSAPEPQQYLQPQQPRTSQPSTSPLPEEGSRPSLPSISNLLGIADGERSSSDAGTFKSRSSPLNIHDELIGRSRTTTRKSCATTAGAIRTAFWSGSSKGSKTAKRLRSARSLKQSKNDRAANAAVTERFSSRRHS